MLAMSRSGQEKQPRTRHLVGSLPAMMNSAALIVVLLAAAGCGRTTTLAGTSGAHATVTPTSPILRGPALSWTAGIRPPGYVMLSGVNNYQEGDQGGVFTIAPSDGNVAYSCMRPASTSMALAVWVTHDRAQHWTQVASLPSVAHQLTICDLIPDAVDPSIVVASVSWARQQDLFAAPPQMTFPEFRDFITFDGGAQWQPLPGSEPVLLQWLATYHGTTLAIVEQSSGDVSLEMSTDQLQTWRELPQAPVGQVWINPVTGDLLVLGTNGTNQQLYESSDLGQHWNVVPMPNTLTGNPLISPPVASQPWRLCATASASIPPAIASITTPDPGTSDEGAVMCSMDGGKTWTERPNLITTFDNVDKGTFPQPAGEVAVGADGSLYAELMPVPASYSSLGIPAGLYQLPPQSNRWQLLNSPPPSDAVDAANIPDTVATTDIPGAGILWALPGNPAAPPGENGPGFIGLYPAAGA
jgi:photosystem II stability/assembly factor-like uncharacterized protein